MRHEAWHEVQRPVRKRVQHAQVDRAVTCRGLDTDRSQKAQSESPGQGSEKKAAGNAAT